jgi:uncharacterized protein with FMN-binding domain
MITNTVRAVLLSSTIFIASNITFGNAATVADQTPIVDVKQGVLHDGSFVGNHYDAYYGIVQVQATVKNGQLVEVKTLKYPNHSGESRSINNQALPILQRQAVQAQSAHVRIVSGATLTSKAYISSLNDALVLAGK